MDEITRAARYLNWKEQWNLMMNARYQDILNSIKIRRLSMCHQNESAKTAPSAHGQESRMTGGPVFQFDYSQSAQRSKFRPFVPSSQSEQREADRTQWKEGYNTEIDALKLEAQRLADRIETLRKRRLGDERAEREFDLARTALEDVVMRATRGLTS